MHCTSLSILRAWLLVAVGCCRRCGGLAFAALQALGPIRRWFVLALRTLVVLLIVFALAEIQMVRTSQKLAVIYLLDQSVSIPEEQRRAMADYVNAEIKKHRHNDRQDYAGVVVFGRDAATEWAPDDEDIQIARTPEARVETDHTNIAGALKLAMASFPKDAARRVVIVSDGNENMGNAMSASPRRWPRRESVSMWCRCAIRRGPTWPWNGSVFPPI